MNRARRRCLLGSLAAAWAAVGCAGRRPAAVAPMQTIEIANRRATRADLLLVMLPGAYSRPQEFLDEGFVEALRVRGLAADVTIADAHLGYFVERTVLERLRVDVVRPARERGYRQVWLLGISLGGFGALGYARRHPAEVDGVLTLAPYLGGRLLHDEIVAAGGPRPWSASRTAPPSGEDLDRELWHWLASLTVGRPPVHLGYGLGDRFADSHDLLRDLLPAAHVVTAPGGHDWRTWRALWNGWLDRGVLARAAGPAAA